MVVHLAAGYFLEAAKKSVGNFPDTTNPPSPPPRPCMACPQTKQSACSSKQKWGLKVEARRLSGDSARAGVLVGSPSLFRGGPVGVQWDSVGAQRLSEGLLGAN